MSKDDIQLLDLEKKIGAELVVSITPSNYCIVYFEWSDIKQGSTLIGEYGEGKTVDAAMRDYANKIQGKKLVLHAGTKDRKEYTLPMLKHTST